MSHWKKPYIVRIWTIHYLDPQTDGGSRMHPTYSIIQGDDAPIKFRDEVYQRLPQIDARSVRDTWYVRFYDEDEGDCYRPITLEEVEAFSFEWVAKWLLEKRKQRGPSKGMQRNILN